MASAIAAHVMDNPQACRVLMEATTLAAYEPALAAKVQAASAVSLDQLTGLFAAGAAAGEWPAGTDPAVQARLFTAGLYGLMAQWHTAAGSFPLESAMTAVAGQTDDAIRYQEQAYAALRRVGDAAQSAQTAAGLDLLYRVSLGNTAGARIRSSIPAAT